MLRLHCAIAAASLLVGCVGMATAEPLPTPDTPTDRPGQQPAVVVEKATAPDAEDGAPFEGPSAPLLEGVQVVSNRDSVTLVLPIVPGVSDYRVFRLPVGARVTTVGAGERVTGTTLHCAGYRQRNDRAPAARELLRVVEVTDVTQAMALVVEAIDAPCPFPGLVAQRHVDLKVESDEVPVADRVAFAFFTEAEVAARHGSLVRNGHGKGATLAAPAPPSTPRVLARTTVRVTPTGKDSPRTKDFFDDFDGTSGPLVFRGAAEHGDRANKAGRRFSNTKWDVAVYNDDDEAASLDEVHGLLRVTLPDWHQDVFSSVVMVPRRAAKLSDTNYLHVTFEVASNATSRRYWWFGLCGAGAAGQTFDAEGHFAGRLVQTPFFYQDDGLSPSLEKWNCLQFFPRDGSPFDIAGASRSEADVRVMVNRPGARDRDSVVNLSPAQYPANAAKPSWFRMQDAAGVLGPAVLDDRLQIAPRTRFDAWIRRDRLVLYVDGQQRLCNDFGPHRLTMAEGAVAMGQVLYHSTAERLEFSRSFNDRTGQRYYLENAPYADEREWDNVGFEEEVGPPAGFEAARCYVPR
ncbi:MAG: hypothetical protein MUC96_06115 [Myxococcaceae bacterium]|jgi:hypothetical protein|nr:hypothetical protein [Myxococcaceae bacterium]